MERFHLQTLTRKGNGVPSWAKKKKRAADPEAALGTDVDRLTVLPPEVQLMILSYLDLETLVRLRATAPIYRQLVTVDMVRRQFITPDGQRHAALRGCCCECLAMPGLGRLILDPRQDSLAWRSQCFRCWRARLDLSYQRKYGSMLVFANHYRGFMCHFCAYPVCETQMDKTLMTFHARCRYKRLAIAILWFILTFIQIGLGILGAILGWTIYKHHPTVLIPSTVDFCLSVIAVGLLLFRLYTSDETKYSWALATELGMTLVRIPPVVYTARSAVPEKYANSSLAPLLSFASGIFVLNLVMRFLDSIGYALLYFGYDPRNAMLVGVPKWHKLLYIVCTGLVWWACVPN